MALTIEKKKGPRGKTKTVTAAGPLSHVNAYEPEPGHPLSLVFGADSAGESFTIYLEESDAQRIWSALDPIFAPRFGKEVAK